MRCTRKRREYVRMIDDARTLMRQWCTGQRLYGVEVPVHVERVTGEVQRHWPDIPVEKLIGVLLHEAPECGGPSSHIHDILVHRFGRDTTNMVWDIHRGLELMTPPINVPVLHTHLRTISQQDRWSFRALAAHLNIEFYTTPDAKVIRDSLLATGTEALPTALYTHLASHA